MHRPQTLSLTSTEGPAGACQSSQGRAGLRRLRRVVYRSGGFVRERYIWHVQAPVGCVFGGMPTGSRRATGAGCTGPTRFSWRLALQRPTLVRGSCCLCFWPERLLHVPGTSSKYWAEITTMRLYKDEQKNILLLAEATTAPGRSRIASTSAGVPQHESRSHQSALSLSWQAVRCPRLQHGTAGAWNQAVGPSGEMTYWVYLIIAFTGSCASSD